MDMALDYSKLINLECLRLIDHRLMAYLMQKRAKPGELFSKIKKLGLEQLDSASRIEFGIILPHFRSLTRLTLGIHQDASVTKAWTAITTNCASTLTSLHVSYWDIDENNAITCCGNHRPPWRAYHNLGAFRQLMDLTLTLLGCFCSFDAVHVQPYWRKIGEFPELRQFVFQDCHLSDFKQRSLMRIRDSVAYSRTLRRFLRLGFGL